MNINFSFNKSHIMTDFEHALPKAIITIYPDYF